ncbi:unnamed protein product (macronuclear) [Paramecium tetraurelia]|uniref:Uncharacterized protein n=1 Tax=Paramecium tetraurelia TaxID=5888 RepID=A0D069_PARTE|nr:uncharacterized protein GSPATT00011988001 [Paramecium tetraurelia]CAK76436.1 unnamed protein product [Paramecium tetraurelia]|eukprot:XP_001443833.1 hypothetical protein (macronuclear) [Paramecium tetraurelia strain d4-2]
MDLRNKNTRKILLQLLDKQLKSILSDNHPKTRLQEQLIRFQGGEYPKQEKQRQYSPSPQLLRTHSQSEHVNHYQRQQSQLKLKNQRPQQSKERLISLQTEEQNQENTFHPKILRPQNLNSQIKPDNHKQGIKQMQSKVFKIIQVDKTDHIDKLKESNTIKMNQETQFKPTQNKSSQKIIKQNDFFQRMSTNENRRQQKIQKLRNDATPSFKPQINNRLKKVQNCQNKDILQVSVNLGLLEKIRDYHKRDNSQSNLNLSQTDNRNRDCTSALSQTIEIDNSQSPSFRNSTIKKQSLLQIDFNSPNNDFTEMLYEALGDSHYDCF